MARFGIVGLDTMGVGLCANAISKGHEIVGFNRSGNKTESAAKYLSSQAFIPTKSAEDFMKSLSDEDPAIVVMLVRAGNPTWDMFRHLSIYMSPGTIVLDMANEHPDDTSSFEELARAKGIRWLGVGISGGRKGAEGLNEHRGPAIMAGGDIAAYKIVEPVLTDLSAKADFGPCCGWFGPGMAGHRVKNVHNGIEYDIMMCMAEVYTTLLLCGLSPVKISEVFQQWVAGIPELRGYLMDIAIAGLRVHAEDGTSLLLKVVDDAKAKGTGKNTSQIAMDEGIPIPGIDMAVLARCLSAFRDQRVSLSRLLDGPDSNLANRVGELLPKLRDGLFCSMIMSYDQGFMLLGQTEKEHGYKIDRARAAEVWTGGCIINSRLLPTIREAFREGDGADRFSLLDHVYFQEQLNLRQQNWREAVSAMVLSGVPCLASCGNLGAYDSLRTSLLHTASFNQMLRDTFGDHRFTRFDQDGIWSCDWDGDGSIGLVSG